MDSKNISNYKNLFYLKQFKMNKILKSSWIHILLFAVSFNSFAQLSDLHYLPPLRQAGLCFSNQKIYLSTPEINPFTVNVYQGTATTPLTTLTVSNANHAVYSLTNGGNNDITLLNDVKVGIVQSNSGLRFESTNGAKFYVNWRGNSASQASSLTSKGRAALGTAFKWGGVPNRGPGFSSGYNAVVGFMATEDNTTIQIFGYNPNCTFRLGTNPSGITSDAITINLNAGQTYVLEALISVANSPNIDGWLGASITSNKNIAVNIGQMLFQSGPTSAGQDAGIDQIIPENTLGKEYVFVRGNGIDELEFPVIVATVNNTKIYVNGDSTPIATINNGDYYAIPSSYYSASSTTTSNPGANMYVYTSHEAYAFQSLAGSTSGATGDINFIAPVNCLLSNTVDNIPAITVMAGATINGGISIIASTAIADSDIIVKYGNSQVSTATLINAKKILVGNPNWKTYFLPGLTGNVSVSANGPIAVGFFGDNSAIGASGYFSGFETIPTVNVTVVGDGCLPSSILTATPGFTSYAWYNNGVLIPSETSNTYTPTSVGNYTVVVSSGTCNYESAFESVNDCNPELVLSVSADNQIIASGSTVVFTVSAKYFAFENLSNLIINNIIPSNVTITSATPSFGTWNATTKEWTIGTMYPGEEHILTIVATANTVTSNTNGTYSISSVQTFTGVEQNNIPDDLTETITTVAQLVDPNLNTFSIPYKHVFSENFEIIPPLTSSTGNISYTSSNPNVASISNNIISINSAGTSLITAWQASDLNYFSSSISFLLTVNDVNVLTRNGKFIANLPDYLNHYGEIGKSGIINPYGKITQTEEINDGLTSSTSAESAQQIKQNFPNAQDGIYWINIPGFGPKQIYCIMDSSYDGGGWMLALKATTGTTFNYNASYWTTPNTLNSTDVSRNNGDAKYDVMNGYEAKDIMAIWPDIPNISQESGSIDNLTRWNWIQNDFHNNGQSISLIDKFNLGQVNYHTATNGSMNFSGYNSSVFSKQDGFTFYGINYVGNTNAKVRWGFAWNNEADQGTNDVSGGIGLSASYGNFSAGDRVGCCQSFQGINRSARVELYVR